MDHMDILIKLIVCFLAGMGAGLGTGFAGMSAAAVISPMLITFLDMPAYEAVGIALASDVLASAVSAYTYGKNKNLDIKNGLVMMAAVLLVTMLGSYVASLVPNRTMGSFSMVMTLLLGIKFIAKPVMTTRESMASVSPKKRFVQSVICGSMIGFICGFVGAGGGMMMLLILTSVLGYELKTAVGTSVFIMVFTAFTGAVTHFIVGGIPDLKILATCVTVTFIKLLTKLYALTGDSKYINYIEKSGYNALFGAVNNEKQTMKRTLGLVWKGDEAVATPHDPYPFDSYSPLYLGQRAKKVGGFMVMQNGKTYGCCASIGGAGTAIFTLDGVVKTDDGVAVNLYNDCVYKTTILGAKFSLSIKADVYGKPSAKITVKAQSVKTALKLRIPDWMENLKITVDDDEVPVTTENGYLTIDKVWTNEAIVLSYKTPVKAVVLNDKVAFTRGPITLCRDERFGEDMSLPISVKIKKDGTVPSAKVVKNEFFDGNLAVKIPTTDGGEITLTDYSQAGKNYDCDNCTISVWNEIKK